MAGRVCVSSGLGDRALIERMESQSAPLFQTTLWTDVLRAADDDGGAQQALDELVRRYWQPLFGYALRVGRSPEDAEDATQGFFAKLLQNRSMLSRADRGKGRFRSYLLAAFKYFMADLYEKSQTQRRGGGVAHVSLEAMAAVGHEVGAESDSPEEAYDRRWAQVLVERAMVAVREELAAGGHGAWFDRLGGAQSSATPYAEVAEELGTSLDAVKSFVVRMKRRFRAALEREVAATVASPEEVESEMAYLASLLRRG
jgi:RNA polymerase sigma factor (sigma-70 family)